MKVLHVSDLHIGKRVNGMSMLDDQRYILRQILDIAEKRQVSVLLIAGDVYDKASPSAEAVTVFDAFLTDAVAAGLRVLAIPGNHDSAERIAYAQGLLEKQGVCLPPVYAGEVERVELEDEHGPVEFWLLPFLKPGDVRRFFPDEEIGDDYSAALRTVLGACDIDQGKRNVVLSHQLVTAYGTAPDRADDEIKLGGMDNVDVSVYDAFDYVALGHLHRAQTLRGGKIRYCGAPLVYSFDECAQEKSATLVTVGEKGAPNEFEFVPFQPLHRCVRLEGTLAELCAMPRSEDYLQALLTDELRPLDALGTLQVTWPNVLNLQFLHLTGEEIDAAQEEADRGAMGPLEHFAAFYAHQNGRAPTEAQLDVIREILREGGENL